jgi:hypothetical protein
MWRSPSLLRSPGCFSPSDCFHMMVGKRPATKCKSSNGSPSAQPLPVHRKNVRLNASCRWRATFNKVANSGSFRNPFKSGSVVK